MRDSALMVFTGKTVQEIMEVGGSGDWFLHPDRAATYDWLVCTRNRQAALKWAKPSPERHRAGFLIGKISGVIRSPARPDRWLVQISEYALIDVEDLWPGVRNPIAYTCLADLGIDASKLDFKRMPQRRDVGPSKVVGGNGLSPAPREANAGQEGLTISAATVVPSEGQVNPGRQGLTIAEAKVALAATYGVRPESIEIIIRG